MNFDDVNRACYETLFLSLPHPRQIAVMMIPGGHEARELAGRAVEAATVVIDNWFATANRN